MANAEAAVLSFKLQRKIIAAGRRNQRAICLWSPRRDMDGRALRTQPTRLPPQEKVIRTLLASRPIKTGSWPLHRAGLSVGEQLPLQEDLRCLISARQTPAVVSEKFSKKSGHGISEG